MTRPAFGSCSFHLFGNSNLLRRKRRQIAGMRVPASHTGEGSREPWHLACVSFRVAGWAISIQRMDSSFARFGTSRNPVGLFSAIRWIVSPAPWHNLDHRPYGVCHAEGHTDHGMESLRRLDWTRQTRVRNDHHTVVSEKCRTWPWGHNLPKWKKGSIT